jgi:cytochrome P450
MVPMPFPLPPGPSNRELLGKIGQIQSDPLTFLVDLARNFGPAASFHVFNLPVIVLTSPEGIKHVLQDQNKLYSKDTVQYNALAAITGKGLLTSDGAEWLRNRRLTQPAFSRPRILALDQIVMPALEKMLAGWEEPARRGLPVDIDREMMRLTLEVVGKALFSIDLSSEAQNLTGAVLTTLDHIVYRVRNVVTPPAFLPTPRNIHFRRALRTLDRAIYTMLAERKQAGETGSDLLGMLLAARDEEGLPLSDRQIRDELMTMLVAGHETVASALTWTWLLLAQYPQIQDRFYKEIHQSLSGRPPNSAALDTLPYTGAVFSEALRLYPPAWLITRTAREEDETSGFRIPKGGLVILSPYAVHRQAEFWPEPLQFQPERFTSPNEPNRYAYIPFGAGPRICIGNFFAQVEAKLILAGIAQRYRLELAGSPPAVDALVTLRPRGGLPMRLLPVS